MAKHYRLPSIAIQFAESGVSDEIQLFRTGKFHHDQYGTFEITAKTLADMKVNFDKRVRGIDIAVDYKHDSDDVAAGWIRELELKEDGNSLWAKVEWTPNARKILSDKEFRYISPDFTFDYRDNESLMKYGPVLLGAGLTNRPVIKKMEPAVELMEGQNMMPDHLEKMCEELKMAGGDACVAGLIPELMKMGHPQDQAIAIAYSKCGMSDKQASEYKSQLEERKKMSEEKMKDLEAKLQLAEQRAAEAEGKASDSDKKVAELEAGVKLAEKKGAFAKLLAEGKVCAAQEQAYLDGDMAKFVELAQSVKLNEVGSGAQGEDTQKADDKDVDVEAKVMELAEKHMKAKEMKQEAKSLAAAISHVLMENKELAQKYNQKFGR